MKIEKALKKQKFHNKIFYIIMILLAVFLPLCTYLAYINSTIMLTFLALINKINKSTLKFSIYNNKLKIKNGLFLSYSLIQCDKVAIVHTNKSNEDMEIIIITPVRYKNKKLHPISKDFMRKNKEAYIIFRLLIVVN